MIKATFIAASLCLSLAGYATAQSDTSGASDISKSDSGANTGGNAAATDNNTGDIANPDQSDTNTKGSAATTTTEQTDTLTNPDGTETKCADGSARATQSGGTTGESAAQGCKDGS
ncbi:hypothetical protein [Pararhizobium sp.]|uniref:hypothetical protein n=1 Tax=Pararhizobium sp. TaxID=1977563 RepID=UPI00271A96EB|nr:hypothetical protein [Pararhizobium sp.]MDO9415076.1 hypothetical protein [Pararhizobium sp.]